MTFYDLYLIEYTMDKMREETKETVEDGLRTAAEKAVWSGVMLESPDDLLSWWSANVGELLPKTFAHHMTIKFKPSAEEIESLPFGKSVSLHVDGVIQDEHCQAVRVRGYTSANPVAHITVATDGASPAYSNKLFRDGHVEVVEGPSLPGRVGAFMSGGNIKYAHVIHAKHDPSRNDYQNKYQKNRYHERKAMAIKMLGGKCSVCGTKRNLELDHKNPGNKSFTITKLWSVPEAEFKKEVRKCRLLCHKHHMENSAKQREKGQVKSIPGKSKYTSKNRKKAAVTSHADALALAQKIAENVGSALGCTACSGSEFDKSKHIENPVIAWNAHDADNGGYQLRLTVYGREKDNSLVQRVVQSVKDGVSKASTFDYVDDQREPGLLSFAISGLLR